MEKAQVEDYFSSLLSKSLRITTTDTRMFNGQLKCTDSACDRSPNATFSSTFSFSSFHQGRAWRHKWPLQPTARGTTNPGADAQKGQDATHVANARLHIVLAYCTSNLTTTTQLKKS